MINKFMLSEKSKTKGISLKWKLNTVSPHPRALNQVYTVYEYKGTEEKITSHWDQGWASGKEQRLDGAIGDCGYFPKMTTPGYLPLHVLLLQGEVDRPASWDGVPHPEPGWTLLTTSTNRIQRSDAFRLLMLGHKRQYDFLLVPSLSLSLSTLLRTQPPCWEEAQATWG